MGMLLKLRITKINFNFIILAQKILNYNFFSEIIKFYIVSVQFRREKSYGINEKVNFDVYQKLLENTYITCAKF